MSPDNEKKKNGRKQRSASRHNGREDSPLAEIMQSFVVCGRCSFFVAGYRVIHGEENLLQAAENSSGKWLHLSWNLETRHLVQKAFGCNLDVGWYFVSGSCPECRRRYVYRESQEDQRKTFRVQLKLS